MKSMTKLMVVAMILAAALVVAPVAAARNISDGGTIYVGEDGLVLNNATGPLANQSSGYLVKFSSLTDRIIVGTPIRVDNAANFDLTSAAVGQNTGVWYAFSTPDFSENYSGTVFIENPRVDLDVRIAGTSTSLNERTVTRSSEIIFRLDHNLVGLKDGAEDPNYYTMCVEVTRPGGGTVRTLNGTSLDVILDKAPNSTGVVNLGGLPLGTYTARAVWPDKSADLTDSNTVTFEVVSGAVAIEADKDSVIRGNGFTVTITGESSKDYVLNVTTSGTRPPMIIPDQPGVKVDNTGLNAIVTTSASGTRTVEFNTTRDTEDKTYTIKVSGPVGGDSKDDEVKVRVEEGTVTITTSGTGTYYIGEEITLSGTCTESEKVYLFMTGPNLWSNGVNLTRMGNVVDTEAATFTEVNVEADDTWSYDWATGELGQSLDAGGYTLYAVSAPQGRNSLSGAKYATATIQLRPGFVTATVSGATVASGDDIKITGTAQGSTNDVQIWIFGKNFYGDAANSRAVKVETVSVEDDGTFEYELDNTELLSSGQYFVIVQHPMSGDYAVGINGTFLTGPGIPTNSVDLTQLTASAAANAVINALNSPYSDDKYTKLTFFLEDAWIRIDPIGDQSAGSTFTITGTTNLAAGGELIVEVTSAAFQPGAAGETSGFSSDAGTVTIQQGETANTWSFEVDGTTFRPDQYTVTVESIETQTSTSTTFNIVEGPAPTPTGTETTTPTGTETTTPTGTTTTEPTPTQSPGFGALVALAGLGAVAFLVLRRD